MNSLDKWRLAFWFPWERSRQAAKTAELARHLVTLTRGRGYLVRFAPKIGQIVQVPEELLLPSYSVPNFAKYYKNKI